MQKIDHIYDKIFKKVLTLSPKAVISAINGLFQTDYPLNSELSYNWTEFEDDKLRRILADTIVTINHTRAYHIEATMYEDQSIVVRMFDYGFAFAKRERLEKPGEPIRLKFPRPMILYLTPVKDLPDHETMILDFGEQGSFTYRIPIVCFPLMSMEEVSGKRLLILLPFRLLQLRALLEKDRSEKNIENLQSLIENDIFNTIREGYESGQIEANDARMLFVLTRMLYQHLYSEYEETKELTKMYDESILFDFEIAEREKDQKIEEQLKALKEKSETIRAQGEELDKKSETIRAQNEELQESRKMIEALQAELLRLKME